MELKKEFLDKLSCADKIVFFTGAGISAESGISTFRGADGLWSKLKPE
ncbi:MAG TPA: Sir2 family NAD-dependent protein deacetylase, partial [Ignavibacteriales bacterium]|nr:Sir2 family NAD-dependent protein deacetylase [Ignavibacteriales bacterium]